MRTLRPDQLADASDEALVACVAEGDDQAYAVLVQRYQRRVHGICYRYFGDPADAQDAAQDAFVALYRKAGTFRGGARFSTWMYRVTTNACNDIARRRTRRPRKAEAVVEDLPLADPEDGHGRSLLRMELREALLQLDPDQRDAVIGHSVEGRPYHEIAEQAGVAVGTIKSRVHRGHARLAAILADGGRERSDRAPPPT